MRRAVRAAAMLLTASVTAGMLSGCDAARATVSRVVDGDTVDVVVDGREQRIRLLNIDTPETVHPDEDVQCLGPEAAAHLRSLLPAGTEVEVLVDEETTDRYDRVLAGIRLDDGRLVNAEMARAGLALPMQVGANDRFLPEVEQAHAEAVAAGRGLYDPEIGCTVPGQVTAVEAAATGLATPAGAGTAEQADTAAAGAAAVAATALALHSALSSDAPRDGLVWAAVRDRDDRPAMAQRARTAAGTAEDRADGHRATARELRTPPPPPAPTTSPRPTTGSTGGTASAPRQSPATRQRPRPAPAPAPEVRDSGSSGGSGGPPGYTGPRCYAPGGKTWTPC
ncbi:thermonuclease family protein [Pseudonocardia sp. NPDC046786]|uniref:thermonuclease family protein n=1 Tax=Pseudonocardia sp. NPDC046786 TaxID=3155471 RepID=UPI0033CE24ED